MQFEELFHNNKPIIGMIHTNSDSELSVLEMAKQDIEIYLRYGIHPLVENYYGSEENCEEILEWLHKVYPEVIYGVNILGDEKETFRMATKYNARFVQIDSVCGHMSPEEEETYVHELKEYRTKYNGVVLGGVRFKYYDILSGRTLQEDLLIGSERCDAIVCTGSGTGIETPIQKVKEFKALLRDFPVIVGAGVFLSNAVETIKRCEGMIVGSWFKYAHNAYNMVNELYVREFMETIQK